jgi:hypothetical protein
MSYVVRRLPSKIEVLKPVDDSKQPLGYNYIDMAYPNILLLAKKNSGKTNVIYNILKHCANKHTEVLIFCPTWELDATYKIILDYLDKKQIPHQQFKNVSNLRELMQSYDKEAQPSEEPLDEEEPSEEPISPTTALAKYLFIGAQPSKSQATEHANVPKRGATYHGKYIVPEHIFIFDDLKKVLRDPAVNELIATNRHYKAKVICSTQYFSDVAPDTRANLDIICIFPKIPLEKIKQLHEDLQIAIEYPIFEQLYLLATEKPHNFLYANVRGKEKFKFNFNEELVPD